MMTEKQKQMVMDNINLPHFVMRKRFTNIYPGTHEYDDLVQEGYFALCKAVLYYDEEISKFSTYAVNYIWGYILRYMSKKTSWSFAIRDRNSSTYTFIPYGSLNIIVENDNDGDNSELLEFIQDYNNKYTELDVQSDLLHAFKKSNDKYGEKIFLLRSKGYSQIEISKILGISRAYISRIVIIAEKIYKVLSNYDENKKDETIINMINDGFTANNISDILNIDIGYVKKIKSYYKKKKYKEG